MSREDEIEAFNKTGEADRITMEAMQLMEEAGITGYPAVLSALINCVFTPSENLPLEEQAQLHAMMRMYVEERIEILEEQLSHTTQGTG